MNDIVATSYLDIEEGHYTSIPNTPAGPDSPCLPGPGQIKLIRYRDGRLDHEIIQGQLKPTRFALIKNMRFTGWNV